MQRMKIILNPVAGKGFGARAKDELDRHLRAVQIDYDLVQTTQRWHAAELAREAADEGYGVVVAAGGDGTTNEVVNGLAAASEGRQDSAPALGVLPMGSGSDFASAVGMHAKLAAACRQLADGQPRPIDIVRARMPKEHPEWRYYANALGIGFDAFVTLETLKVKRLRGIPLYLLVVLKTLVLHHQAPVVTIECDDHRLEQASLMVVIANGSREGGGFFVAPQAKPDDGLLDLCIASRISRPAMLALIPHFLRGTHVSRKPITMTRATRVAVSSKEKLTVHMDGEMFATETQWIECEILPHRLQVWA
jgi:YegS/Rv2252/BmrU family lipid kinase